MENEKLLVSKCVADTLYEVLKDARANRTSEYINGYGDGIEYALKVLGLMEAKS